MSHLLKKWLFTVLLYTLSFNTLAYERIATLAPHLTEWAYSLGLGDKIVAVSAYSDYPEAAVSKPIVSDVNGINLDALVRLEPDLVLVWQGGVQQGQIEKLERLGIKVHISQPSALTDISSELNKVAVLTQTEAQAHIITTRFEEKLSKLRNQYQNRAKQNTFFQVWNSPLTTANGNNWIQNLLDVCALSNPFSDHQVAYPTVNKEHVMMKNPDIIIISDKNTNSGQGEMWQQLPMINAVKNKRIYYVNPDYLHRYTERVLIGLEQLCQLTELPTK